MTSEITIRPATHDDIPALEPLIARSARVLSAGDYTAEQIEGALGDAFGVDTQLVRDRTYFVVEVDGEMAGCGGWSFRRTLFGADGRPDREPERLDPATEAAKIRAFFVDPPFARRGLGKMLLEYCEAEARAAGFTRAELMSTLPGLRLYSRYGYAGSERIDYPLSSGVSIPFVPMIKSLVGHSEEASAEEG
ncbi:MAG: GNAT family N-acetyltransferase [Holophagales bacterium]|nr:GNAT family N-acetyltransferase [Holophagales bacterium]